MIGTLRKGALNPTATTTVASSERAVRIVSQVGKNTRQTDAVAVATSVVAAASVYAHIARSLTIQCSASPNGREKRDR